MGDEKVSKWTHVAGIFRIDWFYGPMIDQRKLSSINQIRSLLHGAEEIDPEKDFTYNLVKCIKDNIPIGSEGPLRVYVHKWPRNDDWDTYDPSREVTKGSTYWGDVLVTGDLRDFDDIDDIARWLMGIELPDGSYFRGGVLEVQAGSRRRVIFTLNEDSEWMMNER